MSPTRGLPEPDDERSVAKFGTTQIPYAIRRSPRRRTVSIAVHPGHGVVVTAPSGVERGRLDATVRRKGRWVVEKLRQGRGANGELPPREFVDGETFLYLGRQYRLKIVEGEGAEGKSTSVALVGGRLRVTIPRALAAQERPKVVRKALVTWYRDHAARRLSERVEAWAARLGVPPPRIAIREQTQRWASCGKDGTLRFNWRIVQAPARLVEYVVAHELTHLRYRTHTRQFWKSLAMSLPRVEERRRELFVLGRRMVW